VVLDRRAGAILDAEFSPDGTTVVTAEEAGTAHVWDARDGTHLAEFSGHSAPVAWATFNGDGTFC
jgi:WD40 repeat protein